MKQKLLNSLRLQLCTLVALFSTAFAGQAWGEEKTYNFVSKDWHTEGTQGDWTSGKDGAGFSNGGIQVTTAATGANGTSPISFSNVTKLVVTYNTNKSKGAGSIVAQVGENTAITNNVKYSGSADGTSAYFTTEFNYSTPQSGNIKLTVNTTTNSIYLVSVAITYGDSGTPTPTLSVNPSTIAFGEKAINTTNTETFSVNYTNLTEDLDITVGSGLTGVSVNPTTISKNGNGTQEITVTYAPTAVGNISGNITVSNSADEVSQTVAVSGSAYDPADVSTYNLFTAAIEEGDYIIYYNGKAMKNTVASNRFEYETVTPSDDVITTTDASIVWHIAPNGDYWTIYSADAGKYAAGTNSKNQGALIDNVTDLAKWTVTVSDGVYQFENLGRSQASSDSGNKWLRNNGVNGFACYASGTGGALSLYKLDDGTPSISASDVTLAYDATSGSIAYTLKNEKTDGNMSATSSESWLTVGTLANGTLTLNCAANSTALERNATVTLTYTYNTNETVTAEVSVTQAANPDAIMTIAEARAATGSVKTRGVVTSVNYKTAYIQDANAAIAVYNSSAELEVSVGDEIIVEGTRGAYGGLQQITGPTITVVSTGNTITPEVMTIDQANESTNQGWFIKIENATVETINGQDVTISQGENTIVLRFNDTEDINFEAHDNVSLTGNISVFNSTKQIANPIVTVAPDERENANISFSVNELLITQGHDYTTPTFNNPNNVTVTFATTNANVASWDATNGLVLGTATGNATITANFEGNETYKPATVSLAVSVNEDLGFDDVIIGNGIYQKVTSISELEACKRYLVVYENEDEAKVMNGVDNTNSYAHVVTTTIEDNQIDNTTLAATPIVLQNASDGKWYLLEDNKFLYVNTDGNYLNSTDNNTTSGIQWNITMADGVMKINNDYLNARYLMYNSQQPRFACYKNTQKNVVLYKEICETVSVTVSAAGYATFCCDKALNFTNSDIKAFIGTKEGSSLTFNKINKVPANTGVLLYMPGGKTEDIPVATAADNATGNCLVGVTAQTTITADDYILSRSADGVGFYKAGTHTTLAANRAYIPASTAAGIKSFAINFGDADGVEEIGNGHLTIDNAQIFNLAGQRLQNVQKGVNIVNGKKVFVK